MSATVGRVGKTDARTWFATVPLDRRVPLIPRSGVSGNRDTGSKGDDKRGVRNIEKEKEE